MGFLLKRILLKRFASQYSPLSHCIRSNTAIAVGLNTTHIDMECVMKKMSENHLTKLDGQVAQSLGTISLEFIAETAVKGLSKLTNLSAVKWLQVQNMANDKLKHKMKDNHMLKIISNVSCVNGPKKENTLF